MKKVLWGVGVFFLILFVIGTGLYFYYFFVPPSEKNMVVALPPAPVPGPEDAYLHYAKMVSLFKGIPNDKETDKLLNSNYKPAKQDIPGLHQLIEKYKSPLEEFELATQQKVCTFPIPTLPEGKIPYSTVSTFMLNNPPANFLAFLTLGKILIYRGKLAELENKPEDAIRDYSIVIKAGKQVDQTLLITRLIGVSLRAIGFNAMGELIGKSGSEKVSAKVLETIKNLEPTNSFDTGILSKYEPSLRMDDFVGISRAAKIILGKIAIPNILATQTRFDIANAKQEMVYLGAAIRVYQSKNHKSPDKLESLVPDILSKVPQDPFTNSSFGYATQGKDIYLYSVGPDTTDNKAQLFYDPSNGTVSAGDIVVRLAQ